MAETILYMTDQTKLANEDADMVELAKTSLAGFQQLYQRWLSPVYRYFSYRMDNVRDAEDLTSQVFFKVYKELVHYQERGQFSAWLFTIARNQYNDFFRKKPHEISLEIMDPVDGGLDLLSEAIHSEEILRLRQLILTLPENEKELIRLRFIAELGYREIGMVLNRKEDAVRKSITRLLVRLEKQLEASHE